MYKLRINRWLIRFKKNIFTYRNGYFDLPYISNSPAIMVESFKHTPFTKYLPERKEIHTANIFTQGVMRYCELEVGLWIIITEMEFKKNVSTHALFDKEPTDYHFLSHFIYNSPVRGIGINGIAIPTHGWGFSKPGTEIKAYFNKGDQGVFTNFAFSTNWFERNIPMHKQGDLHNFMSFLESKETYKTWDNIVPGADTLIDQILEILKNQNHGHSGIIQVKLLCLQLISQFFTSIATAHIQPLVKLHEQDSGLVARAEKALVDSLLSGFPGVVELAAVLHTSPTKLQLLFKAIYGNSMYQYYQEKQMVLALQMLKAEPKSTKDIASIFGYKNPSKFSVAFKKYHHFLPSQV
ncbi:AraC-like DNA-binding protein [Mucilaginibacter gracilis]|uniref:AraC-like DNA-binding protein n=1 Tax=Mucilaginibacter gracilis TaxID=423350 RepID=A0A495J1B6_9SPHI|nr:AraC family transcriptional regulator [Mucilaginibacter gracilis]RKR82512.1 AraC-like DNA-binding protein [Mucilaginibacter gracilis]